MACLAALSVVSPFQAPAADEVFRQGNWPFRSPRAPAMPGVQDQAWVINPIDAFVLARLEEAGLAPSAPADKLTLLRRLTFDLTGLPPTPEEQAAFLADESPWAYEAVVDRLLASPRYGERSAEHWLDLVRYAESDGFKADSLRPWAHAYRDYVVGAFNEDLPYDRFVAQQLAGDELEPESPKALAATGLLRLYPDEYNAANLEQRRQEILDDITETTGLVFLGLTIGCAECHDHKFDPILQTDFYRLQAFFAPLMPRDDLFAASRGEREEYDQKQAAWSTATQSIRDEMESLIGAAREQVRLDALGKFRDEIQQAVRTPEAKRTPYQCQIAAMAMKQAVEKDGEALGKLSAEAKQRYEELASQLAMLDHLRPAPLPGMLAVSDLGTQAPPTFVLGNGNWRNPQQEVPPGFPEFLGNSNASIEIPARAPSSTGRRSALARWLTRPDHPLTGRVIVNRLWQQHFGVGIVPTPNDFGSQGDPPSHLALLDWLAVELVERNWSLKHIHRLIVTSNAYRQSSQRAASPLPEVAAQKDPSNRLLWHARRRRLEGESIRDAMLALSRELSTRMHGQSARPELPEGISKTYAWQPDAEPSDRNRRSIFILARRNLRFPLLEVFDQPDLHHSCPRRANTTTAPQALLLLNSPYTLDRATGWARQLLAENSDETHCLQLAYRQAYAREPSPEELSAAREFLSRQTQIHQASLPALVDFCHAILNSNEFIYVD